jgi:transcriptional regulator with GAF, ATPase, and Fis domain
LRHAGSRDQLFHRCCCGSTGINGELDEETFALRDEVLSTSMFEEILGSSDAMTAQVMRVAPSDATVLITGESGTGKELIARAIHKRSRRSRSVFTRMNCAVTPQSLIAAELFGYEKGAFTGANQRFRSGKFRLDLFYRLNVFPIHVPPLRERPEDILLLAKYFIERYAAKQCHPTSHDPLRLRHVLCGAGVSDRVRILLFRAASA